MKPDMRSLVLFRILIAIVVLTLSHDLLHNFAFFEANELLPLQGDFIHIYGITPFVVTFVARLTLIIVLPGTSILLILGWRARVTAAIGYWSLYFIQNLNPEIIQGGDVLARMLLFWLIFLPVNETRPLASLFRKPIPNFRAPNRFAFAAYTFQICFVYWFSALLKTGELWNHSGNALFYAVNLEHFASPFGLSLGRYPDFLRALTFGTRIFEFLGPILLLIPNCRARFVGVILFIGFNLICIQALLRIGFYPFVCAVAFAPFIPSFFWDWLLRTKHSFPKRQPENKLRAIDKKSVLPNGLREHLVIAMVSIAIIDIASWNLASLNVVNYRLMERWDVLGKAFGLEQRWDMYAPFPKAIHGWIIVPADLEDGSQRDLFTKQSVSYDKPMNVAKYLGDFRWRRYISNLFDNRNPVDLNRYSTFLVNQWNQTHSKTQRVEDVAIIFMEEKTLPDLTISKAQPKVLCFESYD